MIYVGIDIAKHNHTDKEIQIMVLHFFLGDFNKRTNLHRSATA